MEARLDKMSEEMTKLNEKVDKCTRGIEELTELVPMLLPNNNTNEVVNAEFLVGDDKDSDEEMDDEVDNVIIAEDDDGDDAVGQSYRGQINAELARKLMKSDKKLWDFLTQEAMIHDY